ncbi:porin [Paraburkholderia tropica]|uniref:porin n=1 Tax=Paraburkholderia tropica TaxID=92647 RepID=UPI002AB7C308|nr:porin [Paraburkholderia tropica]
MKTLKTCKAEHTAISNPMTQRHRKFYITNAHHSALTASCIACMLFAGTAHAQSSVTLYGTLDTGLPYISNERTVSAAGATSGHSVIGVTGGNFWPSNWGVTGNEDIGGGASITFDLRNYFSSTSGSMYQPNRIFGVSTVGVKTSSYGSLSLGRQYDSYTEQLAPLAASNAFGSGYGAHFGDVDNLNYDFSVSNAIKYTTPTLGGFTLSGTFAPGGVAGDFATNRVWSVGATYNSGGLNVAAGYLSARNPFQSVYGGSSDYLGGLSCTSEVDYCQIFNSKELRTFGFGATYEFGQFTIGGVFTSARHIQSQYGVALVGTPFDIRFDTAEGSLLYKFRPDIEFGTAYAYTHVKASGDLNAAIQKITVSALYLISKRTVFYTFVNYENVRGAIAVSPDGSRTAYAQLPYLPLSNGPSQLGITIGVRHNF